MTSKNGSSSVQTSTRKPRRHCNTLDGKRWLQNSISVWSDIRKTPEEMRLKHPAMFPQMLVERLIETFLPTDANVVLDPFAGSGSTILAAEAMGKQGIGLELSPEYVSLARCRLEEKSEVRSQKSEVRSQRSEVRDQKSEIRSQKSGNGSQETGNRRQGAGGDDFQSVIYQASAAELLSYVEPDSVDLCITSPPYWNILNQRRTADLKATRHYGNLDGDLGVVESYDEFLSMATDIFRDVLSVLKPGAYCCVIVMDLRKKNKFFPLHSDLAARLQETGYLYDDLIIWNRQSEYNNLRPLGYPSVFRVNKVHEFVLLMQKPK
jgi:DNA modification methylase